LKNKITVFFLFFTLISSSQNIFEISGKIKDKNELPIKSIITISEGIVFKEIVTDSLGFFKITVQEGELKLKVFAEGFQVIETSYIISNNTSISLTLKENIKINEIIITEDKRNNLINSEKNILKINIPQLNELPSLTGTTDVAKILQLTPGVQNSGDVNGYLYIRGGDAGHSIMKYNDTPVYGSSHLFGIFPYYNTFHIGEVVYDKTNLNSINGNVLGASINIKTNNQRSEKASYTGNMGLLTSQFNIKFPHKKSLFSISFRKTYIEKFLKLIGSKNESDYNFKDLNFSFSNKLNDKSNFSFDFFYSNDNLNYDSDELFADINLNWDNLIVSSQYNFKKNNKLKFQSMVYLSTNKSFMNVNQDNLLINVKAAITDLSLRNLLNYKIKKINFETGLLLNNYSIKPYNLILGNFGFSPKREYPNLNSNMLSLYQDANFSIWNELNVKTGLRINYVYSLNYNTFSTEPKLGIYLNENRNTNYYFSFAKKTQHLSLVTTSSIGIPTDFWISSQKEIPYQKSSEFSFGINNKVNQFINSNLSVFYNEMKNLVIYPFSLSQFNETSSLDKDIFLGKGKAYGLEFLIKKEKGNFKGWLSYTLSKSLRRFDSINQGKEFYSKYDRRHNFSTTITYDFNSKVTLGLTQILSSGNRYVSASQIYFINNVPVKEYNEYNNSQLPFYNRTDLSINFWLKKAPHKESKLIFSIYNVFNIKNPIYQSVNFKKEDDQISIFRNDKVFYKMLPSINWYFKF
jgi:hypothetical protein